MKNNKWIYIGYSAAWIAVSLAVCVAINKTGSLMPMWAFIFPGSISISNRG